MIDNKTVHCAPLPPKTATLLVLERGKPVRIVTLNGDMHLGREGAGTHSDITLQSSIVSRNHGDFSYVDGVYYYRDNNSLNGTFLNGKKMEPYNEHGTKSVALHDGDVLRIDRQTPNNPHPEAVEMIFSTTFSPEGRVNQTEYAETDTDYDVSRTKKTTSVKPVVTAVLLILLVAGVFLGVTKFDNSDIQNYINENIVDKLLNKSSEDSVIDTTEEIVTDSEDYVEENTEDELLDTSSEDDITDATEEIVADSEDYVEENAEDELSDTPPEDDITDTAEQIVTEAVEPVVQNVPHISDYRSHISGITSSSHLADETYGNVTYVHSAEKAFDNDMSTCWSEGVDGYGKGESITISFDGVYEISELSIYNSLCTNEDLFYKNSRLKSISVILSGGNVYNFECFDGWENRNNTFSFEENVETSSLTIIIQSVYEGNKYQDTCISEIIVS